MHLISWRAITTLSPTIKLISAHTYIIVRVLEGNVIDNLVIIAFNPKATAIIKADVVADCSAKARRGTIKSYAISSREVMDPVVLIC